jgi:hypothetical protein
MQCLTALAIVSAAPHNASMPNRSSKKNPRDVNQLAKSIVDQATGEAPADPVANQATEPAPDGKNPNAVALGRLGGKKGGPARAAKLSKKRRSEIAKKAAAARWGKKTT